MEISPIRLAQMLLYSVVCGLAAGALFDCFRIVRTLVGACDGRRARRLRAARLPFIGRSVGDIVTGRRLGNVLQKAILFFGDFATLVCATVGIIVLNYAYNDGKFRSFTVIGAVAGYVTYYFTLGRVVRALAEPLAILVKYIFLSILVLFSYPFYFFCSLCFNLVRKSIFLYTFAIEKKSKRVYNIKEEVYLQQLADVGFTDLSALDEDGGEEDAGKCLKRDTQKPEKAK